MADQSERIDRPSLLHPRSGEGSFAFSDRGVSSRAESIAPTGEVGMAPAACESSAIQALSRAQAQASASNDPSTEHGPGSVCATPASEAQINWRIEAVAHRSDIRGSLLAQGAQMDALDEHQQEVIERLLRLGFQPRRAHPKTVIWVVCCNVLAAYRRRGKASRSVGDEVAKSLMATVAGPEDRLNRSDAWSKCCCWIATLPEGSRRVVYMRHIMELSFAETAARLEVKETTARVADSRGMAELTGKHPRKEPQGRRR